PRRKPAKSAAATRSTAIPHAPRPPRAITRPWAMNPPWTAVPSSAPPISASRPPCSTRARPMPTAASMAALTMSSGRQTAGARRRRGAPNGAVSRSIAMQVEKERDQLAVQRPPGVSPEVIDHRGMGKPAAIRPVGGQGVVDVHHRDDAGADRDGGPPEPVRVAAAVEALVVVAHDQRTVAEELERRQDLRAGERMPAHLRPFVVGEWARLAQHPF